MENEKIDIKFIAHDPFLE